MSKHSMRQEPADPRHPSDEYLQRELDDDRVGERMLILQAFIAIAFVGVIVVIRQVFFV